MKITLSTQCLCGGKFTKFMVESFYQLVGFASLITTAWNTVKRTWPPDNNSHKYAEHGSCLKSRHRENSLSS